MSPRPKRGKAEGVAQTFESAVSRTFQSARREKFERVRVVRRLQNRNSAIQQTGMSALRPLSACSAGGKSLISGHAETVAFAAALPYRAGGGICGFHRGRRRTHHRAGVAELRL